jgi:hypothetical protein
MRSRLLAGAACALLLAGCGGDPAAAPSSSVRLHVSAPADLASVREGSVEVRGTVRPAGAQVTVRGARAQVSGSTFSARVDLAPGVNVVDVLASADHARPALTAVRVRRIMTVPVPDVTGLSADAARRGLERAGLKADTKSTGGFFDQFLGGTRVVCRTDPASGGRVDIGTTVHVFVGRSC